MNLSNLKADVRFLCGATSANYPDTDLVRNINNAYHDVARLIWSTAGGWQFDDGNNTTLPTWTTNLSSSVQNYTIPSTIQKIEEVTIKDIGGTWNKLKYFDIHGTEQAPQEFMGEPGLPIYYDLMGTQITLYPTPTSTYCTTTSGMCVYVSRDMTEFDTTATTTTPGFPASFHKILSYAAAIDFVQNDQEKQTLLKMKDRLEKGLTNFYQKRGAETDISIKPRHKSYWRQYI